jgi:uncharacterized protein (TIGR02268 family)
VPLLLLVLPTVALAQAASLEVEPPVRQLELSQMPRPELWVAPDQATLVQFDTRLDTEAMQRASVAEGLRRVEVSERSVTLRVSSGVKAGDWLEYPVRFADGQPAEGVTLVLRVDSARAEPVVEVYRGAIPAEALKRQVAALNARVEALLSQEASLMPLMSEGLLGPAGVKSRWVKDRVRVKKAPGLSCEGAWLQVAPGRAALEMTLTLTPGAPPWVPGAVLLAEASHPKPLQVRSMRLVGGAARMPGSTTRLLVEWDTPLEAKRLKYRLRVKEQNGDRELSVELSLSTDLSPAAPAKERTP